jgi:LPXTG-motif cell wall-anchored protein
MQTTSTQERNTMKKVLLTLIATGSATIAAVIAFASPASAEIVEICTTLNMETFTVVIEPCEDNGPLIDPNEGNEEDINIYINLGTDFDFDWTPIDPADPEEEEDGTEEDVDDSAEETIQENVGLGIEEDVDDSAEETTQENADAPAETEEIAITDEVLETEEELPATGVNSVHMVLIALALLVAGSLLLASSKIKAAEKVVA